MNLESSHRVSCAPWTRHGSRCPRKMLLWGAWIWDRPVFTGPCERPARGEDPGTPAGKPATPWLAKQTQVPLPARKLVASHAHWPGGPSPQGSSLPGGLSVLRFSLSLVGSLRGPPLGHGTVPQASLPSEALTHPGQLPRAQLCDPVRLFARPPSPRTFFLLVFFLQL